MTLFSRCLPLVCVTLALLQHVAAAGPLEELKNVSGLGASLDAQRLKRGEVISARGGKGSFLRGTYIESCYFVKRPLAMVGAARVRWDSLKPPDEETSAYQLFRAPATADFARVARLKPEHAPDRWMLDESATVKSGKANDLHLTPADVAIFQQETRGASAAWEQVLRANAAAAAAGGLAPITYRAGDTTIAAQTELRSLLGMAPEIAARFTTVTDTDPSAPGDRWYYAERSLTQGHDSFSLGTLTAQPSPDAWQIMDWTYYTADTYFMSADLYYLWAWEDGTLVWQIDYVSAPFQAYRQGLDKLFAGREMIKKTGKSIASFRHHMEQ